MIRHNTSLLRSLLYRDFSMRYRESLLGGLWMVAAPLLSLAVYFYVFSVVFKARWNIPASDASAGGLSALILFSGLISFNFFAECFGRAPYLMRENPSYIKKIVFPLHLIPLMALLTAALNLALGFALLFLFYFFIAGLPPLTVLALPLALLPLFLFTLGVLYLLSALGVFLPDLKQVVGPVTMACMFLSPIFYPLEMVPNALKSFVIFNPFTWFLEGIRGVLFWGKLPELWPFLTLLLLCFVFLYTSYWFFQKSKKGFADVL